MATEKTTICKLGILGTSALFLVKFIASGSVGGNPTRSVVDLIANEYAKGNAKKAMKIAKDFVKEEGLGDCMDLLNTRKRRGYGIGPKPGAIVPASLDGIETYLEDMEIKGIDPEKGIDLDRIKREKEALLQTAFRTAAVAEITLAYFETSPTLPPSKNKKRGVAWAKEMRDGALALADGVNANDLKRIEHSVVKLNLSCASCHAVLFGGKK